MATGADIAAKLDEARALIEKGWTKGAYSRNWEGGHSVSSDPRAICWCAAGAIGRACPEISSFLAVADALAAAVGTDDITEWNDAPDRTQAEVIEAFRKAAALARVSA